MKSVCPPQYSDATSAPQSHAPFAILSADQPAERAQWIALWNSWPQREVFAHPQYVGLLASQGHEPLCASWDGGPQGGKVLYPFLLRRLENEPYWSETLGAAADLVTPYGYGGPFCWDSQETSQLACDFWRHFEAWATAHHVVSEFVRFSLFSEGLLPYPGTPRIDRDNVVRDLTASEEDLWREFKHKVRKNVNKAERSGVQIAIDPCGESLDDFLSIYRHTMDRRHASETYLFSPEFFQRLHKGLPGQFIYFHALHQGRVISTELVLVSAENVYSFLGGTDQQAFDLRPNDLLKVEIIRWAKAQGKKRFILGGGYEPNDGIFQYKTAFAPQGIVPFQVGHRILDPQRYNALVAARRLTPHWQPRDGFFPAYRA